MISRIVGILSYKESDHVLIDVHGVGYEVFLSDTTLAKIPKSGAKISLYTELIVREDLLQLVGFMSRREREWYRLLTGVQGVGAKAALKILGTLEIGMLARSILTGDANTIKASPGIGPKIAQRIVTELKDKAPSLMAVDTGGDDAAAVIIEQSVESENLKKFVDTSQSAGDLPESASHQMQSEALSALTNLGYASYDAALAISNAQNDLDEAVSVQNLIRLALKNLSTKV